MTEPGRQGNNLDPWYDALRRAHRRASARHEVRALFAVASRPEVVSLAGGMPFVSALPAGARHGRRRARHARTGRRRAAVRLGPGHPRAARADPRGDGARGHPAPASTTSSSRPDRSTRSSSSPSSSSTRATSSSPRGRATSPRWSSSGRSRPRSTTSPMDERRPDPRGAARAHRARCKAAGKRIKFLYTIPTLPQPGRRHAHWERRMRDPRDRAGERHPGARGQPLRPALLRPAAARTRCARSRRTASSTSAPSRRPSPRASGSAGLSPPTPSARSSCWPTRRRSSRPSSFTQIVISEYLVDRRLEGSDRHLPRRLPRAQGRDALRARRVPARPRAGRTPPAASTSGSPCPSTSTRRRCCRARSRNSSPTPPAPRSTPTAAGATTCGCRSATRRPSFIREGIRRLATVINGELDLLDTFAGTGSLTDGRRSTASALPPTDLRLTTTDERPDHAPLTTTVSTSSSSPAASPTSATSRCAPAAASPTPGQPVTRSSCATRMPPCSPTSRDTARTSVWPALHGASGEDGALLGLLDASGHPVRRLAAAMRPRSPGTSRPRRRSSAAPESPRPHSITLPRERSASSAPTACSSDCLHGAAVPVVVKPARAARPRASRSCDAGRAAARDGRRLHLLGCRPHRAEDHRHRDRGRHHRHRRRARGASRRRDRALSGVYSFEARYNAGETRFYAPARLSDEVAARAAEARRGASTRCSACGTSRASTSSSTRRARRGSSRRTCCPGLTETSLVPRRSQLRRAG